MSQSSRLRRAPLIASDSNPGKGGKANEDRKCHFRIGAGNLSDWAAAPEQSVYVCAVADGVTGQAAGADASTIAIETIQRTLRQMPVPTSQGQTAAWNNVLEDLFASVNREIMTAGTQQAEMKGMSTTLIVAVVDGWRLYVGYAGDSRAYLIRNRGITQLTRDHTWVQDAVDAGRLTEEEAKVHPNRHTLLNHLGSAHNFKVETRFFAPSSSDHSTQRVNYIQLQPGDALLLCSDGLSNQVSDGELCDLVTRHRRRPQSAVQALIAAALQQEETDNITALVLVMPEEGFTAALETNRLQKLAVPLLLLLLIGFWLSPLRSAFTADGGSASTNSAISQQSTNAAAVAIKPPTQIDVPVITTPSATATPIPETATLLPTETSEPALPEAPFLTTSTEEAPATEAVPTQEAALLADATDTPTTSGALATPTLRATSTRRPTPTPVVPTFTRTPRPTATKVTIVEEPTTALSTPLSERSSKTPGNEQTGADMSTWHVSLLSPLDGTLRGRQLFRWQADNFTLSSAYLYELVLWAEGEQPFNPSGGATAASEVAVDFDRAIGQLPDRLQFGKEYHWSVFLVDRQNPLQRYHLLNPGWRFRLEGGGGDNGNNQAAATEQPAATAQPTDLPTVEPTSEPVHVDPTATNPPPPDGGPPPPAATVTTEANEGEGG
ncbi:MAG: protein phosphatase 2C domain-containing protein [Caldilineaceae bacterium]